MHHLSFGLDYVKFLLIVKYVFSLEHTLIVWLFVEFLDVFLQLTCSLDSLTKEPAFVSKLLSVTLIKCHVID